MKMMQSDLILIIRIIIIRISLARNKEISQGSGVTLYSDIVELMEYIDFHCTLPSYSCDEDVVNYIPTAMLGKPDQ